MYISFSFFDLTLQKTWVLKGTLGLKTKMGKNPVKNEVKDF